MLLEGDYFNKVLLRMLKDFINKYRKFIISLQLKESLNIASAALMVNYGLLFHLSILQTQG